MKKYMLAFQEVTTPITDAVTKLGGQPVWLSTPQWPLSRETGQAMCFIAQVALYPDIFGAVPAQMAYLFLTDDPDIDTYDPASGENAVILQPGTFTGPVVEQASGPSLYREFYDPQANEFRRVPCEFRVILEPGADPDLDLSRGVDMSEWGDAMEPLRGDKIGGVPGFVQAPEYPDDGVWRLLLQIEEPLGLNPLFKLNFGGGVGYTFMSTDGTRAGFLWQR